MTPGTILGRYVVRRKLAEGGMAEIFLAAVEGPEGFEKEVVIKRIRSHFANEPGFVRMFVDEARVASRLHHPNIVQIFDFDRHEDSYSIAMEYVRGRSLWELRRRCRELLRPLPPVLSAWVAAEVARALEHAHGLELNGTRVGLVHRDVTPHNVLLSFDGAVKLGDFGIARVGQGLTAPGTLKGKFAYMSPEQARGEPVDARTDVFALGIVLWELLTGGRLFEGSNELAILRAVQEGEIAPPARLNPDVPERLSDIVLRALSRDPAGRFQTAGEFERALREMLLTEARSVEDTDLGAFLRAVFAPEPAPPSRTDAPAVPAASPVPARGALHEREEIPTVVVPRGDESAAAVTEATNVEGEARPAAPFALRQALAVGGIAVLTGALFAAVAWRQAGQSEEAVAGRSELAVPPPAMAGTPAPPPSAPPSADSGSASEDSAPPVVREPVAPPAPVLEKAATLEPPASGPVPPRPAAGTLSVRTPGMKGAGEARARPPESSPASEVAKAAASSRTAPVSTGTLRLSVVPWAQVWAGGRELGEVAAQRDFSLPVGTHVLRLEHPRHRRELSVTIRAGEITSHALDLRTP
jgi:serine/threonine-protein kinase